MSIAEEYYTQARWRKWEQYINLLPITASDTIIDLGCGAGGMASLLATKAERVVAIDMNEELLQHAGSVNMHANLQYINGDLANVTALQLPQADGIWCSFAAAYFPNLALVLEQWASLLKPGGWIALVEINDLFAHYPMHNEVREQFKSYYEQQRKNGIYDFEMGGRLRGFMEDAGLEIPVDEKMPDKELAQSGAADADIITGWEKRLNRMKALQSFFGAEAFAEMKTDFLTTLASEEHVCEAEVRFVMGRKK